MLFRVEYIVKSIELKDRTEDSRAALFEVNTFCSVLLRPNLIWLTFASQLYCKRICTVLSTALHCTSLLELIGNEFIRGEETGRENCEQNWARRRKNELIHSMQTRLLLLCSKIANSDTKHQLWRLPSASPQHSTAKLDYFTAAVLYEWAEHLSWAALIHSFIH